MDPAQISAFVDQTWDESIVPELCEYVRIPNKSPVFDPDWQAHGHMEEAVALNLDPIVRFLSRDLTQV